MRVILIDDEPLARSIVKEYLKHLDNPHFGLSGHLQIEWGGLADRAGR